MPSRKLDLDDLLRRDRLEDERLGTRAPDFRFTNLHAAERPWHETRAEIDRAFRAAELRIKRLRWVRRQLDTVLTRMEADCIRMVYLEAMPVREVAAIRECHQTTVRRAIARGVVELRARARQCPSLWGSD